MGAPNLAVIAIPLDLVAIIRELVKSTRKDSDGGIKITVDEAEAIAGKLADLADHLVRAVASARQV